MTKETNIFEGFSALLVVFVCIFGLIGLGYVLADIFFT